MISWILVACEGQLGYPRVLLDQLLTTIIRVFQTRGDRGGIDFIKSVRGNVLNYLSSNPERLPGVSLRASGLPKCLGALARIIEEKGLPTFGWRVLLTVLFSTRALTLHPEPDIKAIEDPLKKGASYMYVTSECSGF